MKLSLMLMVILAAMLVSPGSACRRRKHNTIPQRLLRHEGEKRISITCNPHSRLIGSVIEIIHIDLFVDVPSYDKPHRELLCCSKCKLRIGPYLECHHQFKNVTKIRKGKAWAITFGGFKMWYELEVTSDYVQSQYRYRAVVRRQHDGLRITKEIKCTSTSS